MGDVSMFSRFAFFALAFVALAAATNEAGTKYLAENKNKEGVITLPSGLQYKVLKKGSGAHHPTKDSPCECHHEGCNEREKGFIVKMKDAGAEKLKKELARLKKMSGGSMKPELQAWMMRRINVLTKMTKEL